MLQQSPSPPSTSPPPQASLLLYHQSEATVEAINSGQSSWKAATYPQFQGLTQGEVLRMRGGPKSRILHAARAQVGLARSLAAAV